MPEREAVSLLQRGEGEDLVFLHGYLACKESFYYQIEALSARFRVTAFDFWGMGRSAPLREAWSVSDYAAHTLALLDELGISRAFLLAHSFGGRVALKLLAREPQRFPYALLTGCAGIPPRRGAGYAVRVKAYRAVRRVAPRFAEKHFGSAEYRTLSPVMKESYKKIVNEDLTPCLWFGADLSARLYALLLLRAACAFQCRRARIFSAAVNVARGRIRCLNGI